jgi:hypothetical protein
MSGAIVQASKLFLLPLLLSSLCLTSCVQNAPKSFAAINGNWHIAGGENSSQYPLLTLALGVDGNLIYGHGSVGVNCSSAGSSIGGSLSVTGQVASDGTFELTNASSLGSIQVAIRGRVPADGSTTWAGSFTLTNAASQTLCTFDVQRDFVATAYPLLNGTYAGTITGRGVGSGMSIVTQVAEGAFASLPRLSPNPPLYFTPLSATIIVSGSPCFTTGTTAATSLSEIAGDYFVLNYTMNDGSTLSIDGFFTDPSESILQVRPWFVNGGKCDGISGSGNTLTRQ